MRGSPERLAVLRHLLAARFPTAAPRPAGALPTGIAAIDAPAGGLPTGALTEIVAPRPGSGGQLLILRLLEAARAAVGRVALVDGVDAFDPQSHAPDLLPHLIWVRCRDLTEAMPATDILVHDANLALVVLDLRGSAIPALRRLPASAWYRLQRAVGHSDSILLVISPLPCVAAAGLRFQLHGDFNLGQLETPQTDLLRTLPAALERRHGTRERKTA